MEEIEEKKTHIIDLKTGLKIGVIGACTIGGGILLQNVAGSLAGLIVGAGIVTGAEMIENEFGNN